MRGARTRRGLEVEDCPSADPGYETAEEREEAALDAEALAWAREVLADFPTRAPDGDEWLFTGRQLGALVAEVERRVVAVVAEVERRLLAGAPPSTTLHSGTTRCHGRIVSIEEHGVHVGLRCERCDATWRQP